MCACFYFNIIIILGIEKAKVFEMKQRIAYDYFNEDFLYPENISISFTAYKAKTQLSLGNLRNAYKLPQNQCGYWKDHNFYNYKNDKLKTKYYRFTKKERQLERSQDDLLGVLVMTGDSVTREFYNSTIKSGLCENVFQSCLLNSHHLYKDYSPKEHNDFDPKRYIKDQFTGLFDNLILSSNKSYLVINFGLHLLGRLSFRDSMKVFQLFLKTLVEMKERIGVHNFPTVIWKTTTPPHLEAIPRSFTFRFLTRPVRINSFLFRDSNLIISENLLLLFF